MAENIDGIVLFKCVACKMEWNAEHFEVDRYGCRRKCCIHCKEKRMKATRCPHGKNKYSCKACGNRCPHDKKKDKCKVCSPQNYCTHDRQKDYCKECGGKYICQHGKQTAQCKECKGSQICIHNKFRSYCRECRGVQICHHKVNRRQCWTCDPQAALCSRVRTRAGGALGRDQITGVPTTELLGCSKQDFYKHIEAQFVDGMCWERIGEIHIDHRIPIEYGNPTLEEKLERLNFMNCSPMWAYKNMAKGSRWADCPLKETPNLIKDQLKDDELIELLGQFGF